MKPEKKPGLVEKIDWATITVIVVLGLWVAVFWLSVTLIVLVLTTVF